MAEEFDLGSFHLVFRPEHLHLEVDVKPKHPEKHIRFRGVVTVDQEMSPGEIQLQGKNGGASVDISKALFLLTFQNESAAHREVVEIDNGSFAQVFFDPAKAVGFIRVHDSGAGRWILHARVVVADGFFAGLWTDLMTGTHAVQEVRLEVSWEGIGFMPEETAWQDRQEVLIENTTFEFTP